MGIFTRYNVHSDTIIYISNTNLLYINKIRDDGNRATSPGICFSFNGNIKSANVIKTECLSEYIAEYKKCNIMYTELYTEKDYELYKSIVFGRDTTSNYTIYSGERMDVYKEAIREYDDISSKKFLSALINPNINHGENAVFAIPESKDNDWTGINLEFETPITAEDVIIPLCGTGLVPDKYSYKELLLINIDSFKPNISSILPNLMDPPVLGYKDTRTKASFNSIPTPSGFMTMYNSKSPNYEGSDLLKYKSYLKYKLNISLTLQNNNIKLTDLVTF